MGGIKENKFIDCNRFYQITNLKEAKDVVMFNEFPCQENRIDFKATPKEFKKIQGTLVDCYMAEYGEEKRKSWNLIFSDDEGFFKLGSSMTKIFRSLLNRIASLEDPNKEMEISVFQSTELKQVEWKEKAVTYKNIAVRITWEQETVKGKYNNDTLALLRVKVNNAAGVFKEIDYSLEDNLIIDEFSIIKSKLSKKLGREEITETSETTSEDADVIVEEAEEEATVAEKTPGEQLKERAKEEVKEDEGDSDLPF